MYRFSTSGTAHDRSRISERPDALKGQALTGELAPVLPRQCDSLAQCLVYSLLDNNVCERALKMAIMHHKNSLSYKTLRGAQVGDIFMSLIHTCQLNAVNPFDYLTALQTHAGEVAKDPAGWFPWNYQQAVPGSLNSG